MSRAGDRQPAGDKIAWLKPVVEIEPEADVAAGLGPSLGSFGQLEVGRSCILPPYRSKRTLELLWRGIWAYAKHYRIDALFGCASLEGTNPLAHAASLSFLAYFANACEEWSVRALEARHVGMQMIGPDSLDKRRALAALPPLIKAYLRCGAKVGDG